MWLMLGFHQQFLNATPKTAESEHDEMVRWSRCLKVQTGTKPEIQLEVTKLLSGEYTFKTCPSPGIRLFEGGEAGSAQLGTLEPVSEMQISQVWFDNCKAPNDNLSMHVISRWSVRYVSCLPFSQSWFCTLACKNRFLHNLNNLHIFLYWCFSGIELFSYDITQTRLVSISDIVLSQGQHQLCDFRSCILSRFGIPQFWPVARD